MTRKYVKIAYIYVPNFFKMKEYVKIAYDIIFTNIKISMRKCMKLSLFKTAFEIFKNPKKPSVSKHRRVEESLFCAFLKISCGFSKRLSCSDTRCEIQQGEF